MSNGAPTKVERDQPMKPWGTSDKVWDVVLKVLAVIAIPVSGYIVSLGDRVSRLEESNATIHQWYRSDIRDIKAMLKDVEARLRMLEQKVN